MPVVAKANNITKKIDTVFGTVPAQIGEKVYSPVPGAIVVTKAYILDTPEMFLTASTLFPGRAQEKNDAAIEVLITENRIREIGKIDSAGHVKLSKDGEAWLDEQRRNYSW